MHAIVEARWFSTCTQPVRANAHKFAPPSLTMIINGKLFDAVSPTSTRDSLSTGRKINEKRKYHKNEEGEKRKPNAHSNSYSDQRRKRKKKNANKNSCSIIDRITNSIRIDRSIDGSYGNGWVGRKGGLFATMAAEPKEKGTLIKEALNSGFRARTTVE